MAPRVEEETLSIYSSQGINALIVFAGVKVTVRKFLKKWRSKRVAVSVSVQLVEEHQEGEVQTEEGEEKTSRQKVPSAFEFSHIMTICMKGCFRANSLRESWSCVKSAIFIVLVFLASQTEGLVEETITNVPKPWLGPQGLPVLNAPFAMECIVFDPAPFSHWDLSYSWYRDGTLIKANAGMILRFSSLTREDRGIYTCIASNGSVLTTSVDSNELHILVLLPPAVHIEPKTSDHVIKRAAGKELTLTCEVTEATPWVDSYRWSYLPFPQGLLRPLEGRESTLTLSPLTREDSGQYFCQAWNDRYFKGHISPGNASVTLDVLYIESMSLTTDLEVPLGEHVNLTCKIDSNAPARLAWVVDGREVRHVTANVDIYVLEKAACSDSKTYTCRASNPDLPGLETNASTHLLVNCSHLGEKVVTTMFPKNATILTATDWDSTPLIIALPVVIVVLALFIILILVGFCVRRRQRKQRGRTKSYDNCNAEERQPMLDSPVASSV